MSNVKKVARCRRAQRFRFKSRELGTVRLAVNRTPRHIYAQIIVPYIAMGQTAADPAQSGDRVVAACSTLTPAIREKLKGLGTGNIAAAALIGEEIARLALAAGIKTVAFDRSGNAYHGRVKALAEKAREHGLVF